MSCKGDLCPQGLHVCCYDCIRKELNACRGVCGDTQEQCGDYVDETGERKQRKIERNIEKRMKQWTVGLLIAVLLLLAFSLWQTWENQKWIKESQKMRSGSLPIQQIHFSNNLT